ncbi:glycosyltransferase [Streptococcus parasuis]|uniref:glycosyltransferase n=1 Tax=Streptococcus parasuis TaxID=1501662 RepID=UPI002FDA20F6
MEIRYFFRSKKTGEFSIEKVFNSIINIMSINDSVEVVYVPEPTTSLINLFKNIKYIIKYRNAVNHVTGDIHYIVPFLNRKQTILTIHDMSTIVNSKGIKKHIYSLIWYRIPIASSRIVTTISKKTADELVMAYPFIKEKLYIVENPVGDNFNFYPYTFNKKNPRILQIGTRENKNLERVLNAIKDIDCMIDIVGNINERQLNIIEDNNISYINDSNISDEEIIEKYKLCDLVIFASTYEGFGLPIIEGQAIGRPIITSNIEPMISVSNGTTCLVDPYNIDSIKRGILKVINNDTYREELIQSGLRNVLRYSADTIARKYKQIYELVAK